MGGGRRSIVMVYVMQSSSLLPVDWQWSIIGEHETQRWYRTRHTAGIYLVQAARLVFVCDINVPPIHVLAASALFLLGRVASVRTVTCWYKN